MPARADLGGIVVYLVIGVIWAVAQRWGKAQEEAKRQRSARTPTPALSEAERARGGQTTQEEAEELERWLREKLSGGLRDVLGGEDAPSPMPSPPRKPTAGPLGRRADVPLESAEEAEETATLEREREVVSYDDALPRHEAPVLVDLDDESVFAAERRRREAERRERALTRADHVAFHRKIEAQAPPPSDDEVRQVRRRRALRQALIASEVLGPPVSERRTS